MLRGAVLSRRGAAPRATATPTNTDAQCLLCPQPFLSAHVPACSIGRHLGRIRSERLRRAAAAVFLWPLLASLARIGRCPEAASWGPKKNPGNSVGGRRPRSRPSPGARSDCDGTTGPNSPISRNVKQWHKRNLSNSNWLSRAVGSTLLNSPEPSTWCHREQCLASVASAQRRFTRSAPKKRSMVACKTIFRTSFTRRASLALGA